ncbi:nitronate monooxygenase family protein [Apibacter sp. HY039]|uniref:NAD(P)H-dependent flavin oxidoreductase n=1 Tax=Apibacter sp. HY039 TaxID=2501476 RepID=UPI002103763E|nr:nitronate monooxygenase [Apibacter sp. HY039]
MIKKSKISELLNIKYPIIQGGMVWNSGWKLVSEVSNCGGLGLLGSGSMYPDELQKEITECKKHTDKPFGVNLPLFYPQVNEHIDIIVKNKIPVVFTSAGSPKLYTDLFKKHNIKVFHVVSSLKFALKAEASGVDAIVAEGFEAGGHNGIEETTTFCLVPNLKKHINLPVIAAGGIATGQQILAALVLGAEGVQIGSRFAATLESSSHINFKNAIVQTKEGDTQLTLKELTPVRLIKNSFFKEIQFAYEKGVSSEELRSILGKGRAKTGMLEGNLIDGELEIGQCSSLIDNIVSVKSVFNELINDFNKAYSTIYSL